MTDADKEPDLKVNIEQTAQARTWSKLKFLATMHMRVNRSAAPSWRRWKPYKMERNKTVTGRPGRSFCWCGRAAGRSVFNSCVYRKPYPY